MLEELPARLVEARDARVSSPGQVERGEVQRQPEELIAQRFGDELVDLVADLPRRTANDVSRGLPGSFGVGRWVEPVEVPQRIQEGVE